MTPREVEELTAIELDAFWRYAEREARETQRELRKAKRRG